MSQTPLAVILPEIGIRSETFIRRHVQDLVDECVVVTDPPPTRMVDQQGGPDWLAPGTVVDGTPGPRNRTDPPPTSDQVSAVADQLRASGVRVVLGEYLDTSLRWLPLGIEHRFRFFAHGHGVDLTRGLRDPVNRERYLALGDLAGVIVPTSVAKAGLVDLGLPEQRITVIPYGTEVPDRPSRWSGGSEIRCVAVGRLVAKKSPETIVSAFALAYRRRPRLRLDYVGDGVLRDDVEELIEDLGIGSVVRLLGALPHDQALAVLRSADVLLHGSQTDPTGDAEGLPVVILEAMAAGLPVVATEHQGVPEAVLHRENGLLAPEGDAEGLAEVLVELADSPWLRSEFGDAGWRRARRLYGWERNRIALLDVLGLSDPHSVDLRSRRGET